MVDMAHFSGLVAGKGYPNPCDHAHVVTSTTHKVFRSARGGIILTNHEDLAKKFNTAVFPGYQGGPLMHVIAAKAAGFLEALQPEFNEFKTVGELITKTLKGLSENPNDNSKVENEVKNEVISLTSSFPIYKNL